MLNCCTRLSSPTGGLWPELYCEGASSSWRRLSPWPPGGLPLAMSLGPARPGHGEVEAKTRSLIEGSLARPVGRLLSPLLGGSRAGFAGFAGCWRVVVCGLQRGRLEAQDGQYQAVSRGVDSRAKGHEAVSEDGEDNGGGRTLGIRLRGDPSPCCCWRVKLGGFFLFAVREIRTFCEAKQFSHSAISGQATLRLGKHGARRLSVCLSALLLASYGLCGSYWCCYWLARRLGGVYAALFCLCSLFR